MFVYKQPARQGRQHNKSTNKRFEMTTTNANSPVVSAIISTILSLVIFASLRFYASWFNATQVTIILGGFIGSWLFIFSLTVVSNIENIVFGNDFQAKFIPEILFCLSMAVVAAGVVHRVSATTCLLFSLVGLYFIDRISNKYHNKTATTTEISSSVRKTGKKHK